jgi:hypothetical protein
MAKHAYRKSHHWLERIAPAVKVVSLLCMVMVMKYEWTIMNQCAAEDAYKHSHNLLRLAHSACNEDYYIFSGVINCDLFRRAVDPAIRAASKAECWWLKHNIFSNTTAQILLALFLIWIVKLLYNYFLQTKRYEHRENARANAAIQMLEYYQPRRRSRRHSPHRSPVHIEEVFSDSD